MRKSNYFYKVSILYEFVRCDLYENMIFRKFKLRKCLYAYVCVCVHKKM